MCFLDDGIQTTEWITKSRIRNQAQSNLIPVGIRKSAKDAIPCGKSMINSDVKLVKITGRARSATVVTLRFSGIGCGNVLLEIRGGRVGPVRRYHVTGERRIIVPRIRDWRAQREVSLH